MTSNKELSEWIIVDEGPWTTRVIKGTNPNELKNRVAFIEKTPRVRDAAYTNENDDWSNWRQGDKGRGGAHGSNHEKLEQYGFDLDSRKWCDEQLIIMGYILPEQNNN